MKVSQFGSTLTAASISAVLGACFVDSGECVQEGVSVDPCNTSLKVGQTITLEASVDSDPGQTVEWHLEPAVLVGFNTNEEGNELTLIGAVGLGGQYKVRAVNPANPGQFGEVVLTVSQGYSSGASPVQINGPGFPTEQAVVAVGGGFQYVAYANSNAPLSADVGSALGGSGGGATNFFVKQYRFSDNALTSEVTGQFTAFDPFDPNSVPPNIVADCAGFGFWLDRPVLVQPPTLNRLAPDGTTSVFVLTGFQSVGDLAVACDGTIYFYGRGSTDFFERLYAIGAFGETPVLIPLPLGEGQYDTLAIAEVPGGEATSAHRLVLGDQNPDGNPPLIRLTAQGALDIAYDIDDGVEAIAADGLGGVYAAFRSSFSGVDSIGVFNEAGLQVSVQTDYVYVCPAGCAVPECNTPILFNNIVALAAAGNGFLRIVDDLLFSSSVRTGEPDPCDETLRVILLNP